MGTHVRMKPSSHPAQNRVGQPGRKFVACREVRHIGIFLGMSFTDKGSPAYYAGGQ